MERELSHLAGVLREIAHDAGYALLGRSSSDVLHFSIGQYNRVRERLGVLDADYTMLFGPLPDDAYPGDVRIVARAFSLYVRETLRQARIRQEAVNSFTLLFPFRLVVCC